MKFGIPFEIRQNEGRVGATPLIVEEIVKRGHEVFVETRAGLDSGFSDEDYEKAGAIVVPSSEKLYKQADFILKVREPMPVEYDLIRPEHTLFAFFNFINNLDLARSVMARGCSCFAYEMLTAPDGSRPMMMTNGEIAGKMAIQQGMYFLEQHNGGRGTLLAKIAGVKPARVVIIGAGSVGLSAARMAAAMGASVILMDMNYQRLQAAQKELPENVITLLSHEHHFREVFPETDLLVTAVHLPALKSPLVIGKEMVKLLPAGAVIVDVDIDRGGSLETSKATNHENPTFTVDGIVHYCVPNLGGVVPRTASVALSSSFLPFLIQILEQGFESLLAENKHFQNALVVFEGRITNAELAEALQVPVSLFQTAEKKPAK